MGKSISQVFNQVKHNLAAEAGLNEDNRTSYHAVYKSVCHKTHHFKENYPLNSYMMSAKV